MNLNSIFNLYFVSLLEFVHKMFIHAFVMWITKIILTVDKRMFIILSLTVNGKNKPPQA